MTDGHMWVAGKLPCSGAVTFGQHHQAQEARIAALLQTDLAVKKKYLHMLLTTERSVSILDLPSHDISALHFSFLFYTALFQAVLPRRLFPERH
jgi:hypothetical protein